MIDNSKRLANSNKKLRPKGYSDLDLIWSIRDIPSSILKGNLKSILYMMVATLGDSTDWYYHTYKQWADKSGFSERSLPSFFQTLEEARFIFVKRPEYYGNQYRKKDGNKYQLNYELILKSGGKWK